MSWLAESVCVTGHLSIITIACTVNMMLEPDQCSRYRRSAVHGRRPCVRLRFQPLSRSPLNLVDQTNIFFSDSRVCGGFKQTSLLKALTASIVLYFDSQATVNIYRYPLNNWLETCMLDVCWDGGDCQYGASRRSETSQQSGDAWRPFHDTTPFATRSPLPLNFFFFFFNLHK